MVINILVILIMVQEMEKAFFILVRVMFMKGNFLNDSFNGNGILYQENGNIIEGNFQNGLLKGKATFYPSEGIPYDIDTNEDDYE